MLNRDDSSKDRDARNLYRLLLRIDDVCIFSSWLPSNTADRLFCCTGYDFRIFSCHIQRGNVPRVCRVIILLSKGIMERANLISGGQLPSWSIDVHPSNGSYPSLPTTTVIRKQIESVGRIFWGGIRAANNTTRHQHYVITVGWTRGCSQWFGWPVKSVCRTPRRSLAYHLILRIPGHHGCLGNRASGKDSIAAFYTTA